MLTTLNLTFRRKVNVLSSQPNDEVLIMNKDEAGGNWKQFKGKVKEQW
ncbi:protein of unknown function [Escherichia coli]|nr:protein of unknown function [Escherichia coli]